METNNKLREALSDACYAMFNFLKAQYGGYEEMANALDKAKSALAEPVKNCEVGTPEEQLARFIAFCKGQRLHSSGHADTCNPKCPCRDGGDLNLCALTWAQMSYVEKEGDSDGNE